jgi:hypothetical protein
MTTSHLESLVELNHLTLCMLNTPQATFIVMQWMKQNHRPLEKQSSFSP